MKKLGLILVLIVLFANLGCGDSTSEHNWSIESEVQVTLKNGDSEAVHMWITYDQIRPGNKLQPGQSSEYIYHKSNELLKEEKDEDIMTIYAGRNGATLTTRAQSVDRKVKKMSFVYNGNSISK